MTIEDDLRLETIAAGLENGSFPRIFAVELCADCNLNCSMCHHDQMKRPKGNLPLELWKRCADQIADVAPSTDVWFSFCGEPLLQPGRLLLMLAYGRRVGLQSLNLNTNGVLLTPEISTQLLDAGLTMIVIGIDGFTKHAYEQIRVGGDRDRVYQNVEHLLHERSKRTEGPEIMVQFIEMDENEGELETFKEHWMSRGATVKYRKKLSWGGRFDTPLEVDNERRIPCPWAVTMMHLFWDGRVPRCPGDTEGDEGAGNAWDEPLTTLWARLGAYRELHLKRAFDELPERCQRCKDWMTGASVKLRPTRRLPLAAS